jgi:hypothetical protein
MDYLLSPLEKRDPFVYKQSDSFRWILKGKRVKHLRRRRVL